MGSAEVQGRLWGQAPGDWAELQEPMHRPLWEAMLRAAEVGTGTRMLDAGCGGAGACLLAAQFGAKVSGLDAAASLIDIARRRMPHGDFRVGEMQELPFDDGAFDAVICACSLQYAEDRMKALREMKRVCDPDGRVVVGVWGTPDKVEYRVVLKAVREALPEPPPGKGPFELSTPGVLEAAMAQAGMKVVGGGEAACPFEYPDFEAFWQASISAGPLQAALASVRAADLKAAVRKAVLPFGGGGRLRLENRFRFVMGVDPQAGRFSRVP